MLQGAMSLADLRPKPEKKEPVEIKNGPEYDMPDDEADEYLKEIEEMSKKYQTGDGFV